jgi:hypothetical protein
MSLVYTRPNVSDLIFHVYERSLHPELIRIHDEVAVEEHDCSCRLRIHDGGHAVEFHYCETVISEILTARDAPLPEQRLALKHSIRGSRDSACRFREEIDYQSSFQVERLDEEIFLNFHQELLSDFRCCSLAREFPGMGRFAPGPISLIRTELCQDSFLIHAFHTFPDNCAVVKTQALFEFPGD